MKIRSCGLQYQIGQYHSTVSGEIKFIRIFAGGNPSESLKVKRPPVASENVTNNHAAVYRKRCKIGGKLITNGKSHMGFRFVQKSVTLNDLERCMAVNLRYFTRDPLRKSG